MQGEVMAMAKAETVYQRAEISSGGASLPCAFRGKVEDAYQRADRNLFFFSLFYARISNGSALDGFVRIRIEMSNKALVTKMYSSHQTTSRMNLCINHGSEIQASLDPLEE